MQQCSGGFQSFHAGHSNARIDGPMDSPADGSNATLIDANHPKTCPLRGAPLFQKTNGFQQFLKNVTSVGKL
jgi:hypothetical protein